jgi:hypothetical protein
VEHDAGGLDGKRLSSVTLVDFSKPMGDNQPDCRLASPAPMSDIAIGALQSYGREIKDPATMSRSVW